MTNRFQGLALAASLLLIPVSATPADEATAPWGQASASETRYAPQKVVYDVAVADAGGLEHVLDRVSYLNNLYKADPFASSIVVVLHGDEIPLFAIDRYPEQAELMRRAQSLTMAGPIVFRMCMQAAKGHGLEPGEIHGFVEMVPMADAELVRLQREEDYAYMQ
jgi:hypothetical protein